MKSDIQHFQSQRNSKKNILVHKNEIDQCGMRFQENTYREIQWRVSIANFQYILRIERLFWFDLKWSKYSWEFRFQQCGLKQYIFIIWIEPFCSWDIRIKNYSKHWMDLEFYFHPFYRKLVLYHLGLPKHVKTPGNSIIRPISGLFSFMHWNMVLWHWCLLNLTIETKVRALRVPLPKSSWKEQIVFKWEEEEENAVYRTYWCAK